MAEWQNSNGWAVAPIYIASRLRCHETVAVLSVASTNPSIQFYREGQMLPDDLLQIGQTIHV